LITLITLPFALWQSLRLLWRLRPKVVVGVGGYASFPVVLAAALTGVRTFIFEPNAVPGMANRWLSRFVSAALVVFDDASKRLRAKNVARVAMPVRREIENFESRARTDELFHVLVFGGSQGARPINNAVAEGLLGGGERLRKCKIVHQTGALDFSRISALYASKPELNDTVEVCEYLHDMPARYAWADLIVCRAGTGTISELAA